MKILNFSLDQSLFNKKSAAAERVVGYGDLVDQCLFIVPNRHDLRHELSEKVTVVGVGGFSKEVIWWRLWSRSKKILSHEKFDLITVQDTYFIAFVAWLLARRFRLPFEIQVHGFERFHGIRKFLAEFLLPKANGIRVVSERLKKNLIENFKVSSDKISVIPIFVEKQCNVEFAKLPRSEKEFIFLTVARLVKVKRIESQLEALSEIIKIHPQARLWIVGDGPEREHLERLSAILDIRDQVKFWGRRDDVLSFYKNADAFVLSSDSEGWGMSVIEAGACGLSVIMTDVGLAGEVVKDGESGLIIPVDDIVSLSSAMRRLIEDDSLRVRLAKGLTEVIEKLPTKEQTLELYKKAWETIIKL